MSVQSRMRFSSTAFEAQSMVNRPHLLILGRRIEWIQRNCVCLWTDRQWQDIYDDGEDMDLISEGSIEDNEFKGVIPRISERVFSSIQEASTTIEYTVKCSYMEIYMERIRDLLQRKLIPLICSAT